MSTLVPEETLSDTPEDPYNFISTLTSDKTKEEPTSVLYSTPSDSPRSEPSILLETSPSELPTEELASIFDCYLIVYSPSGDITSFSYILPYDSSI